MVIITPSIFTFGGRRETVDEVRQYTSTLCVDCARAPAKVTFAKGHHNDITVQRRHLT